MQIHSDKDKALMRDLVKNAFDKIAPFWPLQNLIAVNPLRGLEDLPIEQALKIGSAYFQQEDIPQPMELVNRITIKWLQAYSDMGQAKIAMPLRDKGLYASWRKLVIYDAELSSFDKAYLKRLSSDPEEVILDCLNYLKLNDQEWELFLTLMLTTLPGWASYIKHRTDWPGVNEIDHYPITQVDYMALRLLITRLIWSSANKLLLWHNDCLKNEQKKPCLIKKIERLEQVYHPLLLKKIASQDKKQKQAFRAQFIFCIDVRSEPFRKALESLGHYETFGFAGFFGLPIQVKNTTTGEFYSSCPVLLQPKHDVYEHDCCDNGLPKSLFIYKSTNLLKYLYQSLKYTFISPFGLVESLGIASGLLMGFRSFMPRLASKIMNRCINLFSKQASAPASLYAISIQDQCSYAESILKIMGLTDHFSKLIIFCAHGSQTVNNAYASSLDCGACGARHGASNARVMADILNSKEVRQYLLTKGIHIPEATIFLAAEHNTTTDDMILYGHHHSNDLMTSLIDDLKKVKLMNTALRLNKIEDKLSSNAVSKTLLRAQDWAEVRPEWALARNAAFIIGPRFLTKTIDLEARAFLHSYDWTQDADGKSLMTILTAPMVVAQWINTQYLFSTLDNKAYGGGSKITQNITGKLGIMQGNASDLMTGLSFQSVYKNDKEAYHELLRLMTVVYAPPFFVEKIIKSQAILIKLFSHGWVKLACIEPESHDIYYLMRDLTWKKQH